MSVKPAITIIFIIIPALMGFYVGMPYVGSFLGNMFYLLSVLFLIGFVFVNVFYREKIEDLSKNQSIFICITYLLLTPLIYLINSLKPPSVFLIVLFFLYFFLVLVWTFIVEKRVFTNTCIVLLFLCLLPLFCGLSVHWICEEPISDEIKYLENQREYYKNHFDDLNYGVLTKDLTDSTKDDIRELEDNIKGAKKDYSIADFSLARKKVKEGKGCSEKLKKTFELLVPEKVLHDMLSAIDEDLRKLNFSAYGLEERIKSYYPERVYEVERILSDINITKNKSDEAWALYREGKYERAYEFIPQINVDIKEIKEKLDRTEFLMPTPEPTPEPPGFEAIFAIAGLIVIAYLLRRRK